MSKIKIVLFVVSVVSARLGAVDIDLDIKSGFFSCEEFFTIVYQTQYSPLISTSAAFTQKIKYVEFVNRLDLGFQYQSGYFKSRKFYRTDHTYSLNIPLNYDIFFRIPFCRYMGTEIGTGLLFTNRLDSYSLGVNYHYADYRISGLPYFYNAMFFKYQHFFMLSLFVRMGAAPAVKVRSEMDQYMFYRLDYLFYCNFGVELEVFPAKRFGFCVGWNNRFYGYFDMLDAVGTMFLENYVYAGFTVRLAGRFK